MAFCVEKCRLPVGASNGTACLRRFLLGFKVSVCVVSAEAAALCLNPVKRSMPRTCCGGWVLSIAVVFVEFLATTFEIALAWKLLSSNRTMECGRVRRWFALFRHKRCSWLSPGQNRTPLRLALRGRAMSRNTRGFIEMPVDLNKLFQEVWPKKKSSFYGSIFNLLSFIVCFQMGFEQICVDFSYVVVFFGGRMRLANPYTTCKTHQCAGS